MSSDVKPDAAAARSENDRLISEALARGIEAQKGWVPSTRIQLGRQAFALVKEAVVADATNPRAWRLYADSLLQMGEGTFSSLAISKVGGGKEAFWASVATVLGKFSELGLSSDEDQKLVARLVVMLEKTPDPFP